MALFTGVGSLMVVEARRTDDSTEGILSKVPALETVGAGKDVTRHSAILATSSTPRTVHGRQVILREIARIAR